MTLRKQSLDKAAAALLYAPVLKKEKTGDLIAVSIAKQCLEDGLPPGMGKEVAAEPEECIVCRLDEMRCPDLAIEVITKE